MAKPIRYGHYRPHPRVQWTGQLINPHTGEISTPVDRTKQEFKAECDINNILAQYRQTGMVRHISGQAAQGRYEHLPEPVDFQEALHQVEAARASFMSLPANVRDRFHNEPVEFLAFIADQANREEAVKLGLVVPPAPVPAPVVPPAAPAAPAAPPEGQSQKPG